MKRHVVLILASLATLVMTGAAQAEWQTFTVADGLAHNIIQAILEDSNGNLWFGTRSGVSRYDGTNWTRYTTKDGLANDYVRAIRSQE
jgi:ligand-binding sensor domain-containing protein